MFVKKYSQQYCPIVKLPHIVDGTRTLKKQQKVDDPSHKSGTKIVPAKRQTVQVKISWKHCVFFLNVHADRTRKDRSNSTKLKTYIEKHYNMIITPKQLNKDLGSVFDDYLYDIYSGSEQSRALPCPVELIDEKIMMLFNQIIGDDTDPKTYEFAIRLISNSVNRRKQRVS
jgi:hypothetical protein